MKQPLNLENIQHIISVSSGKGGVGKSTVAFHLARALVHEGVKVGLLDADIHGPSLPTLMGIQKPPEMLDNKFVPFEQEGVKAMSIGFLLDPKSAVIWRGLMVQKAIRQLFEDVVWGDLDILVVDMPPGTGDIPLTINQWVPLAGGVIVSTSDPLALADTYRGTQMIKKMSIACLGLVENMSTVECPNCGTDVPLAQTSLVQEMSQELNVPFLGPVPFEPGLRTMGKGLPKTPKVFHAITQKLIQALKV